VTGTGNAKTFVMGALFLVLHLSFVGKHQIGEERRTFNWGSQGPLAALATPQRPQVSCTPPQSVINLNDRAVFAMGDPPPINIPQREL